MGKVEYRKLSKHTGAEILGLDLNQQIPQETIQEIWKIFVDHCVVLFRGQKLEQPDLVRATSQFGDCGEYDRPAAFHTSGQKKVLPQIMLITNIRENGEPIGSLPDGEMWFHHDMLHVAVPHKGTCLYSMEVPSKGGNTRFANCYRAYETLPAALKEKLAGKRAFNSYRLGEAKRDDGMGVSQVNESSHPVFRTHDETGRKAVYVNRLMTVGIEGMERDAAMALLGPVFDHSENEAWVYEHVWRPHDLVVWDNRCSMHARTDFSAGERRLMMRTTIAGNVRPS